MSKSNTKESRSGKSSRSINKHLVAGKSSKTSGIHRVPSALRPSGSSGEGFLALISPKKPLILKQQAREAFDAMRPRNPRTLFGGSKRKPSGSKILFSQDGVSSLATHKGQKIPLEILSATMKEKGWIRGDDGRLVQPIDLVEVEEGFVTLDHRRVVASLMDNVRRRVFARLHHSSEPLPKDMLRRFGLDCGATYGHAVKKRLASNFRRKTPSKELPVVRKASPELEKMLSHRMKDTGFIKLN
ncbi:hypothetical protein MMH89_03625 [Candidatus Comchoanobacter bicostacola]|uniref:Uncharacterized protein n=1 Tax=Candidatus Comchoanobacter bicostacola TaxID=2919598 RepID=A0ABY5DIY4_9GAMM|nr:hypothetical protein [Candidatus Comchoanobacter bicostacola]UTC24314.1 hypothetical protein MMH89_03625 [Candidatus Comchoanobacter bicostacola]